MSSWDDVEDLLVHGRDGEAARLAIRHVHDQRSEGADVGPLEQLDALAPVLTTVIAGIGDDQLDNATPCAAFTVEGVLDHMIGGATMFAAAFRGQQPPALAAQTSADPRVVVREALGELLDAMRSPGALDRAVTAPFGVLPGDTFARFVVLDGLVHGWDIARATGQRYEPPTSVVDDVASFARDAVPPLRGESFGPEMRAPANVAPIERLAAFTGRRV